MNGNKLGNIWVTFKPGRGPMCFVSIGLGKKEAINYAMDKIIEWAKDIKKEME